LTTNHDKIGQKGKHTLRLAAKGFPKGKREGFLVMSQQHTKRKGVGLSRHRIISRRLRRKRRDIQKAAPQLTRQDGAWIRVSSSVSSPVSSVFENFPYTMARRGNLRVRRLRAGEEMIVPGLIRDSPGKKSPPASENSGEWQSG